MKDAIDRLRARLAAHRPKSVPIEGLMKQAAVAAILRSSEHDTELLFIRRAAHDGDPWSGHMAFPGGRVDPGDASPLFAARRETREEIGVDLLADGPLLGELSHLLTSPSIPIPMVIHPFVFELVRTPDPFVLDQEEVAEALWVPLSFLRNNENRTTMQRTLKGVPFTFPCYDYQGRVIWGLTLRMTDELLELLD
jgi:8-oxo-dGTP pyrophosphatase MutT (NUDIX family)